MRQWVFAAPIDCPFCAWDEEEGDYVEVTFTEEMAGRYVASTNAAIDAWAADAAEGGLTRYLPPVLKEHQAGGWRGGSIYGAKVAGIGATRGIYLDVDFLPSTAADIESGHTNFVSIGTLKHYVDYKGRSWSPLIKELSITEEPRLKNLGTIQDTRGLRLSDALNYGAKKKMDETQILAKLDEIMGRLDALESRQTTTEEVIEEVIDDPAIEAADDIDAAEEALTVELSERIKRNAIERAGKQLKALRLNDLPAASAPAGKLSRREEGIRKGLKGKALADYTLGI